MQARHDDVCVLLAQVARPCRSKVLKDIGESCPVQMPQQGISNWEAIWTVCSRRIRSWRIPPHWSGPEWLEEMHAEGLAAALRAVSDYDPARNVPLEAYIRMRVLGHAIARYRREWAYATHQVSVYIPEESDGVHEPDIAAENREVLQWGLSKLSEPDRRLIERLFLEGETEARVAGSLGISQQRVSKRKRTILAKLRRAIDVNQNNVI